MNSFTCIGKVLESEFFERVEIIPKGRLDRSYYRLVLESPNNFSSHNNHYEPVHLTIYLWEGAGGYIAHAQRKDLPVAIKGRFEESVEGPILFGEHIRVIEL